MTGHFLVDTDEWINFFNKRDSALELVAELDSKGEISSSILTVTELRAGWRTEAAKRFMPIFYVQTKIVNVSLEAAELAGKFLKDYSAKGISLPTVDTIIAATAILGNFQLVTRNKKDYPMPELKLYTF